MGVGGGSSGPSATAGDVPRLVADSAKLDVAEPGSTSPWADSVGDDSSSSSSQESTTTGAFFFLGTGAAVFREAVVIFGRGMSGIEEVFSPMWSSRREDWSSEVAVAAEVGLGLAAVGIGNDYQQGFPGL